MTSPARKRPRTRNLVLGIIGLVVAAIVVLLLLLALLPVQTRDLGTTPAPTATYPQAVARMKAWAAAEAKAGVKAPCRSTILGPGHRTARVVVLFHGFTNCVSQMMPLARKFRAEGATVLVPLAPQHGLPGGVENLADFSAEGLRDYADGTIDIASGVGDQIDVAGVSMGGMLAAWAAQERPQVHRAVMVAPALALDTPGWISDAATNLSSRLPNIVIPGNGVAAHHGYPDGTATRATGQMFRLSARVTSRVTTRANPKVQYAALLNANDQTVSNDAAQAFINTERGAGHPVREVILPASLGLPHDTIDVAQPAGRTDIVYPIVVALVDGTPLPRPLPAGTQVTGGK